MTDDHKRSLLSTGFDGDDGTADPALIEVLSAARHDEAGVYAAYAALAGRRVLVPVVAVLGESEASETVGPDGKPLRRDKDSDMAVITLVAGDGIKALPAFTSVQALSEWGASAGYPQARPIPVSIEMAAAATLQENAAVLLLDLGGPGQFEISGSALRAFAQQRKPLPPAVDPEVMDAIKRVLAGVPEIARVLDSARLGQAAEDITVLALGFVPGTDPKQLADPLQRVAAGIADDELLRDRLSGGLQIVMAPGSDN
ncbi:MAG TPA: SseB family protein [Actinospica sp.]|nr:SseB family protein [Actinospica sp.]